MSLNKVLLIGNLGQDPIIRYLENSRVVCNFTIATNEYYTDKNGDRKVETEWHMIEAWDQLAKNLDQLKLKGFLRKGSQVYVEGRIRTENVKDKNGNEVQRKKIKAINIQFLHQPREHEQEHQPNSEQQ
jgi:single-strand DNA-binding protein